jgi:hypothetical protein
MKLNKFKELLMRLIKKDLLVKMLVVVVMILMCIYIEELEHIYVEKNQH